MAAVVLKLGVAALFVTAFAAVCSSANVVTAKDAAVIECSTEDQTVTAGAGTKLQFKCQDGYTLKPSETTKVYSGSSCTNEVELTTLIAGASLTKGSANQEEDEDTEQEARLTSRQAEGTYTLSVESAPQTEQTLCYICAGDAADDEKERTIRGRSGDNQCKVIINVAGTATSTGAPTTTTTTSSATMVSPLTGMGVIALATAARFLQ